MSCSPAWYMSPAGSRACGFWRNMSSRAAQPPRITARATAQGTAARRSGAKVRVKGEFCAKRFSPIGAQFYGQSPPKSRTLTGPGAASTMPAMPLPTMYRVRQSFPRQRLADIPAGVRATMAQADLPIKRGDVVAVGAGSRGIANIAVIVRGVVDHLKELGARPFVFPAMGSHGGATAEGQLEILEHYGITEATMGCPLRASMEVVPVGQALGLPVWCDKIASEADWIGVVNRVKPHTDFKGDIESGMFKMMTIGLGKYRGATQYHRANVNHGYETVITAVGREMLARARIGFGLGIVENGYDETAYVEAFNAEDLEAGERRLLKEAREWMARLPFSPIDVLIVEQIGKNI